MATYNLRRFSHTGTLRTIHRERFLAFLSHFKSYFNSRGINLPDADSTDALDYDSLAGVLITPDEDTPQELIDALYFIHEMSTAEGMDSLLEAAQEVGLVLGKTEDAAPADIAVQVWLTDRTLFERKHAEQQLLKPRSFEYYQTVTHPIPKFKQPTAEAISALEKDLDDWYEKKKRGRGSKVFVYSKYDSVWFLVRHGDPLRREGSLVDGISSSVFYRPEKYDVLVYEPSIGEIRMHACGKGEKDLFRRNFGRHIFGNEDFFPGTGKYSLEPLRRDGEDSLVCADVNGMEWVRLKEVQFFWGGSESEIEIRKAKDVFAAYAKRDRTMPSKVRIIRASFQVKFTNAKSARTMTICPSNIAQYTRDSDSTVVEDWLTKRGFILTEQEDSEE